MMTCAGHDLSGRQSNDRRQRDEDFRSQFAVTNQVDQADLEQGIESAATAVSRIHSGTTPRQ